MSSESLLCGPLLRYTYIDHHTGLWHGSALVVTTGGDTQSPIWSYTDPSLPSAPLNARPLLSENGHTIWRFDVEIVQQVGQRQVEYVVSGGALGTMTLKNAFWIPGWEDSMRIMFYSCNGSDEEEEIDDIAGAALWTDVLRKHSTQPFHVQIGGGDQIYNDGVYQDGGPLAVWGAQKKASRKAACACSPDQEAQTDAWYFKHYCEWFSGPGVRDAMASIPSINIWDDHDLVDGFGSYQDKTMRGPVLTAIGKVGWKYYNLFQLQVSPTATPEEPIFVTNKPLGPYIRQQPRSICTTLGKRILFYGLDCRTGRSLEQICAPETYDAMFERLEREVYALQDIRHLIVLLGIPLLYPRLNWVERILTSPAIKFFQWVHIKTGIAGKFFNKFDGSVELLDDLADQWNSWRHRTERRHFAQRLLTFAKEKRVRLTILSGDAHLAAIGKFWTEQTPAISPEQDSAFVLNFVSSAITNNPPAVAVADVLGWRNRDHKFEGNVRENMIDLFVEDHDGQKNHLNMRTMPQRNYAIIAEQSDIASAPENEAVIVDFNPPTKPSGALERNFPLGVTLCVEIDRHDTNGYTKPYTVIVPQLDLV